MRFVLYVTLLFAVLPLVFTRPFFGLCIYYVVSLLQPKFLCWHEDFQDALLVGIPLIVGAVVFGVRRIVAAPERDPVSNRVLVVKRRLARNPFVEPAWPILACVVLVCYVAVARLFVPYALEHTSYQFRSLIKVVLVMMILTGLASDLPRLRVLYLVVALATAFWAIRGGVKVILLGPHQVYGKTYDNNLFALMSVMALPMVFYFGLSVRHARWRTVLLACAALMCLGIIGSRSRAGFVAFAVLLFCMAWTSRYRLRALAGVAIVAIVAMTLSGREVSERIDSILAYQEDRSAQSRFASWQVARELLRMHPIIGVGFNNFELAKDRYVGGQKAAHNIYLQNVTELGLLGHPLWVVVVIGSMISMYRFMRRSRRLPPDMRWAYYWSRGLVLGMLAFCIHGFFHNEEYLELMFAMVGLNVSLQVTTRRILVERRLETLAGEASPQASMTLVHGEAARPHHPGVLFGRANMRRPALS